MTIHVVRLGGPRRKGEGLRVGTVRRPPRGVPKAEIAARDYYDVWFPELAPSADTVQLGRSATTASERARFQKRYRSEMSAPQASHALDLLAALSHRTALSVGCYCEDEERCHRSVLRELLLERGADVAGASAERSRRRLHRRS